MNFIRRLHVQQTFILSTNQQNSAANAERFIRGLVIVASEMVVIINEIKWLGPRFESRQAAQM